MNHAEPQHGEWAVFYSGSYDPLGTEVRQVAKATAKLVKFEGRAWPRQCARADIVCLFADETAAKQLRDSIAGISAEYKRRVASADSDRAIRVQAALDAAKKQISRLLTQDLTS